MTELEPIPEVEALIDALDQPDEALLAAARGYLAWIEEAKPHALVLSQLEQRLTAKLLEPAPKALGLIAQLVGLSVPYMGAQSAAFEALIVVSQAQFERAIPFAQEVAKAFEGYVPDEAQEDEDQILARLAQADPEGSAAWHTLNAALQGLVIAASLDRQARAVLNQHEALRDHLSQHWPVHGPSARLLTLMHMLDDESIFVIEVESGRCFELHVEGITEAQQLHGFLLQALHEPLGLEPLDAEALAILDGSGPHFTGAWLQGRWTLWSVDALSPTLELPSTSEGNEALLLSSYPVPSLAPRRQGALVVALGPMVLFESWTLMRRFELARASVKLVRELDGQARDELLASSPGDAAL